MNKKFRLQGAKCQGCVRHIENILKGFSGIHEFSFELSSGILAVEYDKDILNIQTLVQEIQDEGYPVTEL